MVETPSPKVVVSPKMEVGVLLLGISAGAVAAYHAGNTGNWEPLLAIAMGLPLVVLFVTSER